MTRRRVGLLCLGLGGVAALLSLSMTWAVSLPGPIPFDRPRGAPPPPPLVVLAEFPIPASALSPREWLVFIALPWGVPALVVLSLAAGIAARTGRRVAVRLTLACAALAASAMAGVWVWSAISGEFGARAGFWVAAAGSGLALVGAVGTTVRGSGRA